MVVASPNPIGSEKLRAVELPVIDLSGSRDKVAELIVKACQEYGFFMVINHGVPEDVIRKMEEESFNFFSKPASEKERAGPAKPLGYGCKTIGFNGDMGEVEYLLFNTNPLNISQRSETISNDPAKFSSAVNGYIEAVTDLACEVLDLMAEGLWVHDTSVFSSLITRLDSDSFFRLNHYPPPPPPLLLLDTVTHSSTSSSSSSPSSSLQLHDHQPIQPNSNYIGFGEHSDPQILTILRSNDVGGLQIRLADGFWVPVPPDPATFSVNVGDLLQAMTNGRFVSVRHRAITNSVKPRMSMAYFGGPPLHAVITSLPEVLTPERPSLYRPFTWGEYKETAHTLRLGDTRLNLFKALPDKVAPK